MYVYMCIYIYIYIYSIILGCIVGTSKKAGYGSSRWIRHPDEPRLRAEGQADPHVQHAATPDAMAEGVREPPHSTTLHLEHFQGGGTGSYRKSRARSKRGPRLRHSALATGPPVLKPYTLNPKPNFWDFRV